MSTVEQLNPYAAGSDEAALWEICVRRDIQSFVAADWGICAADFTADGFSGWDARFSPDPMHWQMTFPSLEDYKSAWLKDAQSFAGRRWKTPLAEGLFAALSLARVEVSGDKALVHKRFDGQLFPAGAEPLLLSWQSIFHLRRAAGRWSQCSFIGYLPL